MSSVYPTVHLSVSLSVCLFLVSSMSESLFSCCLQTTILPAYLSRQGFQKLQEMIFSQLNEKMRAMDRSLLEKIAADIEMMDAEQGLSPDEFDKFLKRVPSHLKEKFQKIANVSLHIITLALLFPVCPHKHRITTVHGLSIKQYPLVLLGIKPCTKHCIKS